MSLWKRFNTARPRPKGQGVGAVSVHPENEESAMLETKLSVPFYGQVRQYHNIKPEIDAKNPGGPGKRPIGDGAMRKGFARRRPSLPLRAPLAYRLLRELCRFPLVSEARNCPGVTTANMFSRPPGHIDNGSYGSLCRFGTANCGDPGKIEATRTRRTKLVPVHWYRQSRGHLGEPPDAVVISREREGIRASRPPRPFLRTRKFRGQRSSVGPQRIHGPGGTFLIHCCSFPCGGAAEDLRVMAQVPQNNRIETIQ